jgi:3-oxoacyl-[acyl-carrier protein] reductase
MMKRRTGVIINLSSVVGRRGNAGQANYSAAKAGLIGLTKSLAREMASRGVRVNAVAPGYIQTEMTAALSDEIKTTIAGNTPLNRLGDPADIAEAVAFLASDAAGFITGVVLPVDGGLGI